MPIACENKRFSSLFTTGNISHRGTSVSQQQNFDIGDVNEGFHNKSCSQGVPNANLFNFTFLLVDFGKVLCASMNELQQNSNASFRGQIPQILTEIHHVYIWPLCPFVFCLSTIAKIMYQPRRPISASTDLIQNRFYVISMEFLSLSHRRSFAWNVPSSEERGEMFFFLQAIMLVAATGNSSLVNLKYRPLCTGQHGHH